MGDEWRLHSTGDDYARVYSQSPLITKLLGQHRRLQEAARKGSKKYVKKGHEGPHIIALQKGLNLVRKNWALLDPDGDFGSKTYKAVEAFQDWANRANRRHSHFVTREDTRKAPGTQEYKKIYAYYRERIKRDGVVGSRTLHVLDNTIDTHLYLRSVD